MGRFAWLVVVIAAIFTVAGIAAKTELLSPLVLNALRASALIGVMGILFAIIMKDGRIETSVVSLSRPVLWLAIAVCLAIPVVLAPSPDVVVRAGAQLALAFTLLILYPAALSRMDQRRWLTDIAWAYVGYLCVLIPIAVYFWAASRFGRMGYPLSSGVFGYHVLVGWALCMTILHRPKLAAALAVLIIFSGSRANTAILILGYGYFLLTGQNKRFILAAFALVGVAIVSVGLMLPHRAGPYLVERADFTSGRLDIWRASIEQILQNPLVGIGPTYSIMDKTAHNSFLDSALSWGLPFAIVTHLIWLSIFAPWNWKALPKDLAQARIVLFGLVSLKALITSTFWTNSADMATLIVSLFLLYPLAKRKRHTDPLVP